MRGRRTGDGSLVIALVGALAACNQAPALDTSEADHEASRAESDWQQRVEEAHEYAKRKKLKEPIESAVGVKELPARAGGTDDPSTMAALATAKTPEERKAAREKIRSSIPIVMYATSWCGVCAAARGYMKTHDIPYTERDVEREADAQLSCISINPRCSVPTFDVDGLVMVGFRGRRLDALIERATDLRVDRMLEKQPQAAE